MRSPMHNQSIPEMHASKSSASPVMSLAEQQTSGAQFTISGLTNMTSRAVLNANPTKKDVTSICTGLQNTSLLLL